MNLLSVSDLQSSYQQDGVTRHILKGVSFELKEGQLCALLGPSGCGKTTLLRCIAGFQKSLGQLSVNGSNINHRAVAERGIGFVFQDYALFPHLTVADNIAYGLHNKSVKHQQARVDELLQLIELQHCAKRYPHELSGGQQQRIALARALAPKPSLLLLDEPFSNLDTELRRNLSLSVRELLKASGVASILVTHDQAEAFAFGDKVGILNAGELEQFASPLTLYEKPRTRFVAEFIGQGQLIDAHIVNDMDTTLQTAFGDISHQKDLKQGSYQLLSRPDDWQVCQSGLSVKIINKQFIGSQTLYDVENQQQRITIALASHVNFDIGQQVFIKACFEHIITFKD